MFVVVGLGNPGSKYAHTRHNVGFDVVEILSQKYDIPVVRSRCKATVGEGFIRGQRVALARPETYMNPLAASGKVCTRQQRPSTAKNKYI